MYGRGHLEIHRVNATIAVEFTSLCDMKNNTTSPCRHSISRSGVLLRDSFKFSIQRAWMLLQHSPVQRKRSQNLRTDLLTGTPDTSRASAPASFRQTDRQTARRGRRRRQYHRYKVTVPPIPARARACELSVARWRPGCFAVAGDFAGNDDAVGFTTRSY